MAFLVVLIAAIQLCRLKGTVIQALEFPSIHNIPEIVADPVIQEIGRLEFEDGNHPGGQQWPLS